MGLKQMPYGHSRIYVIDALGHPYYSHYNKQHHIEPENRIQIDQRTEKIFPCHCKASNHFLCRAYSQYYCSKDSHNCTDTGDQRRCQCFWNDQLPRFHRKREHQIAFFLQKTIPESLNYEHHGHNQKAHNRPDKENDHDRHQHPITGIHNAHTPYGTVRPGNHPPNG